VWSADRGGAVGRGDISVAPLFLKLGRSRADAELARIDSAAEVGGEVADGFVRASRLACRRERHVHTMSSEFASHQWPFIPRKSNVATNDMRLLPFPQACALAIE
jgi:hypothetical protein